MKTYQSIHMIRLEHLNHHSTLYAGQAIEWMMEASFIASELATGIPEGIVYRNTHMFEFRKPIVPGELANYRATVVRCGGSSLTMHVGVVEENSGELRAEGYTTFVTIDPATGKSRKHGLTLDETDNPEELSWRETANGFFAK